MNNNKLLQLYNCLLEKKSWINAHDRFADGTFMMKWFYASLTDIEAKAKNQYCQTIIEYYNQYKISKSTNLNDKKLSFDQKVDIVYQMYLDGNLPMSKSDITFSDGTKIGTWLNVNKFMFKKKSDEDHRLKELYEFLEDRKKNRYRKIFNLNMEKATIILKDCAIMPGKNTSIMLDETHQLYNWLYEHRHKIYTLSEHDNKVAQELVNVIEKLNPDYFTIAKEKLK